MKVLLIFLIIFLFSCSFDNKTGIWNNSDIVETREKRFENFKTLYTEEKSFNLEINPSENIKISLLPIKKNYKWEDEFFSDSNNSANFDFKNLSNFNLKSKKLSSYKTSERILFDGKILLISDIKGNIVVSSMEQDATTYKFNFYKKRYKKIKKNLNMIIEDNIVYVSDNLGFMYALDYQNRKLIWAKNYKVPFRSNLKIYENKIILADQNNNLYIVNKLNGERIKLFPTEENILKNNFNNSISLFATSILFLNTYGTLYSINIKNLKINWFVSLNRTLDSGSINLFFSNPVIINKDKIIVSTDPIFYILDINSGSTISKTNIFSVVSPIISGEYIFFVSRDNLLICMNLVDGKIIYSVNIDKKVANFLETKEKKVNIKSLAITNDRLNIFLNNSYVIIFDITGKIYQIYELPSKISSFPIFIEDKILYLDKKNKLRMYN
tara:strand:- start:233 stop:1552 length:1320 start_codon:yes stop_codon:yes gene_type:complete